MAETENSGGARVDALSPIQYLILEVLAARHRLGERAWTFPCRLRPSLTTLAEVEGLVGWKAGPQQGTALAWLTDVGRRAVLDDRYEKAAADVRPPAEKQAPKGMSFGRRNPHCSNCGDERGGDFGHEISECQYRRGMRADELAATMPPEKQARYWEQAVEQYFERELAEQPASQLATHYPGDGQAETDRAATAAERAILEAISEQDAAVHEVEELATALRDAIEVGRGLLGTARVLGVREDMLSAASQRLDQAQLAIPATTEETPETGS